MLPLTFQNCQLTDLFDPHKLPALDDQFLLHLHNAEPRLYQGLLNNRQGSPLNSDDLIACAKELEYFLAAFFEIASEALALRQRSVSFNPSSTLKQEFVLKRARAFLRHTPAVVFKDVHDESMMCDELTLAYHACDLLSKNQDVEHITRWCAAALTDPEGIAFTKGWTSFNIPKRFDHQALIPLKETDSKKEFDAPLRLRDGFNLTDPRMSPAEIQDQVNYCIYCHERGNDYCSKGFPENKKEPDILKVNPLGNILTGCPLEEKISEMHMLKRDGFSLGALAMIMIDNPMCPATGHRVCNDCMKACIYQKQEPVNIPEIESAVLTDVLNLPWGVEIYDLLTRWNPLRPKQWIAKPYNGLKTLIAGMGPAGFTMAHHLLMEGFAVVGVDGLKMEPLPAELLQKPIRNFFDLKENLDDRLMTGFGGVAEYGITIRWDKNFLKLIYLTLLRRPHFQVFGAVRFGGTITVEDVWQLGFDHLSIAVGAGLPKALPIPGSMAPGMRQANDFLMALQLTGASKKNTLSNLQIRLPLLVIGGGLTGVDAATEAQAYYIRQVEKTAERYHALMNENNIRDAFDKASLKILDEHLAHAELVKQERELAHQENREPNFIKLIHAWGGVTIIYRRSMQESPAYTDNHHELLKAFEEGIFYKEAFEPSVAQLDEHGHVNALVCHKRIRNAEGDWEHTDESTTIECKTILVATGASHNIAYEFEHHGTFERVGMQYKPYKETDGELYAAPGSTHCKTHEFGPFTSYDLEQHRVSFIGDTHPVFSGSVVKAIASAMRSYPKIVSSLLSPRASLRPLPGNLSRGRPSMASELLASMIVTPLERHPATGSCSADSESLQEYADFSQQIKTLFDNVVVENTRRHPEIFELKIHAPMATKKLREGELFRIQTHDGDTPIINNTKLTTDAFLATPCAVDREAGTLTFMIRENSTKAKVLSHVQKNQRIALMGPTGVHNKIPHEHETILIMGNEDSLASIRSVGKALRAAGNKVIYIGAFKTKDWAYCQNEIEATADVIVWAVESGELISKNRAHDFSVQGTAIDALKYYASQTSLRRAEGDAAIHTIPLENIDRITLIGPSTLLKAFQHARHHELKSHFVKPPKVFASVLGPMQCMLKGVCAQCLQWQINPETGKRTKAVFACSWQDEPIELIDFDHIDDRHEQNRMQEILGELWLKHISG